MSNETTPSQNMYPHAMDQVPGITFRQYAAVHILCAIIGSNDVFTKNGVNINDYEAATEMAVQLEKQLQK